MRYKKKNLALIKEEFAAKRERAFNEAEMRRDHLRRTVAGYAKLDDGIRALSANVFAAACEGRDGIEERLEKIKTENLTLRNERDRLLQANGYSPDYAKPVFECPVCSDTGYFEDKPCVCLKKRLIEEAVKSSGLGNLLKTQSFDTFDLNYYSADPGPGGEPSDREKMAQVLDTCKNWAKNFGTDSKSLLFMGGTGLGKTHLSSSVASVVIDKGFEVIYESAPNLLSAIEKDRFTEETEARSSDYFDCDLLIIDDLGTEFSGKNTAGIIYNVINTRLVNSRPTIINTNLSFKELERNYDPRIFSRLFGEYQILLFEGTDLRMKKLQ